MEAIKRFLGQVKVAPRQSHDNLALYPLLAPPQPEPDYLVLAQALDMGLVTITEKDEGGHVPELRMVNNALQPVLIVEGEELVGRSEGDFLDRSRHEHDPDSPIAKLLEGLGNEKVVDLR